MRRLIEESIIADGVQILVKQVSLFSGDFDEKLDALKSDEAKASEMEHAIRSEIHVKLDENPAYYRSLHERLEQIIEDRKAKRIDAAAQLEMFQKLVDELRGHEQAAEAVGLTETGFAIYGVLAGGPALGVADGAKPSWGAAPDEPTKELAESIEEMLKPMTNIVDWTRKEDVQKDMRRLVKRQLKVAKYPVDKVDALTTSVIDLMRVRRGK